MSLPTTPKGWAIHLSKMLNTFHNFHEDVDRFPINVAEISKEYSKIVFPKEPITLIKGDSFSDAFEGALIPKNGEWGILYNSAIKSKGRINFTLGHELGHYLLHRRLFSESGKQCSRQDMRSWQSIDARIECEANIFASHLLMPALDFSKQIYKKEISKNLILYLAERYGVSISAAALKWLNLSKDRAMIVSSKDGFIDWAWSNQQLIKSGIYYAPRQNTIELPSNSLAVKADNTESEEIHLSNVWIGNEKVKEILLYKKDGFALLLLIYSRNKTFSDDLEENAEALDGNLNF